MQRSSWLRSTWNFVAKLWKSTIIFDPRSKKKVRWIVEHRKIKHKIEAMISFISGKKKLVHNGMTIVEV